MYDPPIMDSYRRWWLRKYCRLTHSHGEFKYVTDIEWSGPPSGVYGETYLHYSDGTKQHITLPVNIRKAPIFKARKSDVEVWPHDDPPPPYKP